MIRKTLVTLALTAGMVGGTAGIASAHECFIANRSDAGNAGAAHSENWHVLELAYLFDEADDFLGGRQLSPSEIQEAVDLAGEWGVPSSFTVFGKHMLPRSVEQLEGVSSKAADGKGVDHFFVAYGDRIINAYLTVANQA